MVTPDAEYNIRGKTQEIWCWLPGGMTGTHMIEWCKELCVGPYLVKEVYFKDIQSNKFGQFKQLNQLNHLEQSCISVRIHVKLINPQDIMLFKLTWC